MPPAWPAPLPPVKIGPKVKLKDVEDDFNMYEYGALVVEAHSTRAGFLWYDVSELDHPLKGALLICHGMVDTNVEFQDSVRLVQRLIELRKENWQLAVYPVENHGFVQPSSWADEYKRILSLFEKNL